VRSSTSEVGTAAGMSNVWGGVPDWYTHITGFPFPLRPIFRRPTRRYEVEPNLVWIFEQEHGLGGTYVATNIRMTVIRLEKENVLWVHAPIAPTQECIALIDELGLPVRYVVLPTYAYEHKVFMAPFCRRFPDAKRFVVDGLWSWPVNLPNEFFGIFGAKRLKDNDWDTPWFDEIDQKILGPASLGLAPYVEAAFFHRK